MWHFTFYFSMFFVQNEAKLPLTVYPLVSRIIGPPTATLPDVNIRAITSAADQGFTCLLNTPLRKPTELSGGRWAHPCCQHICIVFSVLSQIIFTGRKIESRLKSYFYCSRKRSPDLIELAI